MGKITAKEAIKKAESYIGTKESPPDSNNVIFNTKFYGRVVSGMQYAWCCAFQWFIFMVLGASDLFCGGARVAYCPDVENYYKKKGKFYKNTEGKPGDLCIMDFGKGRASHIGMAKKKNADGTYDIIEGNTSKDSDDNGGCVMIRTRSTSCIRGFARPNYAEATDSKPAAKKNPYKAPTRTLKKGDTGEDVKWLQWELTESGCKTKIDGIFGSDTQAAAIKFQKACGFGKCDGLVGEKTREALAKKA